MWPQTGPENRCVDEESASIHSHLCSNILQRGGNYSRALCELTVGLFKNNRENLTVSSLAVGTNICQLGWGVLALLISPGKHVPLLA